MEDRREDFYYFFHFYQAGILGSQISSFFPVLAE